MPDSSIVLSAAPHGAFDLVCRSCGSASRLHPDERFVAQIRLFLEQHRHDHDRGHCRA